MPTKHTNGVNERPKDESIAQTEAGLPDDSSSPVDIDEKDAARFEEIIRGMGGDMPK
jgi:hypothetical protein